MISRDHLATTKPYPPYQRRLSQRVRSKHTPILVSRLAAARSTRFTVMAMTPGRRVYANPATGRLTSMAMADYGYEPPTAAFPNGVWWVRVPVADLGAGMLLDHRVTEHDDATISVEPSIVCGSYHGWLIKGQWVEA